jgi:hypothetical protein
MPDLPERLHLEEYAKEQYARAHAWQERAERAEAHVAALRHAIKAMLDSKEPAQEPYSKEAEDRFIRDRGVAWETMVDALKATE